MAYQRDILDEFDAQLRRPRYPTVTVEPGATVGDRASGFTGVVERWNSEAVTLRNEHGHLRHFTWKPGGFVVAGRFVTLERPVSARELTTRVSASGSLLGPTAARPTIARASRIWVEGVHDAELLEHVWGDDLRELGIVVEPLHGADDLVAAVAEFAPGPSRRLGVLLDHLVDGTKESRLAARVRGEHVLVTGHPFVDVWAGVRPEVAGLQAWPELSRSDVPWKQALCDHLGVPLDGFWPRLRNAVRSYADLRPELVGAVEQLIDFVTAVGG